ncbi:MAG: hypothetical protein ACXU87_22490 [Xanthobacteraceae bacterium]
MAKPGEGHETISCLRLVACCALLIAAAPPASAEGAFDIPAGAHFNRQKLDRVGDYLRDEIAQGKIPGAIVLIRQHARGTPEDSADGEKADL